MSTMSFVLERNANGVRDVTLTVKLVYMFEPRYPTTMWFG